MNKTKKEEMLACLMDLIEEEKRKWMKKILPKKKYFRRENNIGEEDFVAGWNACLEKFKEKGK